MKVKDGENADLECMYRRDAHEQKYFSGIHKIGI